MNPPFNGPVSLIKLCTVYIPWDYHSMAWLQATAFLLQALFSTIIEIFVSHHVCSLRPVCLEEWPYQKPGSNPDTLEGLHFPTRIGELKDLRGNWWRFWAKGNSKEVHDNALYFTLSSNKPNRIGNSPWIISSSWIWGDSGFWCGCLLNTSIWNLEQWFPTFLTCDPLKWSNVSCMHMSTKDQFSLSSFLF